ncbi:hypothetical protein B7C42_04840 [Nocardia cerradoensis]|uniref:Uncharacterized protein n=1 Tax=Nocardia cerradoensis TaxID=85688 RepID=A0A231H283_9NOCA|nr:hypothetical protein [Nocardia cerradoensis]OXR42954.1 hypothetical protein B7C42_04840 [Nocardia cerradoensis]
MTSAAPAWTCSICFPATPVTLPWKCAESLPVTANPLIVRENGRLWQGERFHKQVRVKHFRTAGIAMRRFVDGMYALRHFCASVQLVNLVGVRELLSTWGIGMRRSR